MVLRLLNRKFGQLSSQSENQIRQLSVSQLENLGEALLNFNNEQDLVNWFNSIT